MASAWYIVWNSTQLMAQETQPKVYVVDGDDAVRDSMRALIASLDVEARVYPSAEALLAEDGFAPPACVVTEIHLPGMSGIDLQERLREGGVDVPVIVLASRGDVPTAVRALRSGAVDFIEKPFVDQVLVRSIRQALEAQELERLAASRPGGRREIPFSSRAREQYGLADGYFSPWGTLLLADPETVRRVVHQLNARRGAPENALRPGLLNALGLEQEFFQRLLADFRAERDPRVMDEALGWLSRHFGRPTVEATLKRFDDLFLRPPSSAAGEGSEAASKRPAIRVPRARTLPADVALERLLLLWLANQNPAAGPLRELFDDRELAAETPYREMIASLEELFRREPSYGPGGESLFELMCAPIRSAPGSLAAQLEIVAETQKRLSGRFLDRLLTGLGVIKEEEKPVFTGAPGPAPAAPTQEVASPAALEPAKFSVDRSWMPELLLIAKHVKVWLHQLSEDTGRDIRRLDEIPNAALDEIADRGFNGLWLVGLWQRSPASRRIKRLAGNPEAEASAYALSDYQIAEDLGGDEALDDLKRRAGERGIRLACDVVPNHMGLDSPWVVEHPEWFLSADRCPFPGYSFTGEDLSGDSRVGIHLEDGYTDRSDAAVVFRRVDRATGEERFVYHGNDGTSLPWNDTAQLDYLNPDVREMMIETLVGLARRFQIIRIDAAMTLVKQHVQRLWYPPPGEGGDIPSRAERGLSRADFERRMPEEFWRQVVDRVAEEAPDTLLLAEGFWLMETYFVRQLGMHRVYNSAFMHQLRDESNAEFRGTLAHHLASDPGVLKRYVNFLTNPDEQPAIEQLGSDDKYFALCTLLATLPGLPLFGHGQIEGLSEKYGMEYARAYFDESPEPEIVERHERQIVPLLERRELFAECDGFRLYDVEAVAEEGADAVLEEVIAFSNHAGGEHALVLIHNRDATVRGRVRRAVPYRQSSGELIEGEALGEALELSPGGRCRFRDLVTGRELERPATEILEGGLEVELGPYQARVLLLA